MSQVLYHYCSTPTGAAILKSRTFRLSALSAANDSLEGRVLARVFSRILSSTGLAAGVIDVAAVIVEGYADSTEGFALCLSENGDLLSQWRAYGADGAGLAIGFDSKLLAKDFGPVNFGAQFFEVTKIGYGEDALIDTLSPVVKELQRVFSGQGEFVKLRDGVTREAALYRLAVRQHDAGSLFEGRCDRAPELLANLLTILAPLHFQIYATKPEVFHEEREWRLLRHRHRVALADVEYHADPTMLRPFVSSLIDDPAKEVIREVVVGPKHRSDINWLKAFLASSGLEHVQVTRSKIESYR